MIYFWKNFLKESNTHRIKKIAFNVQHFQKYVGKIPLKTYPIRLNLNSKVNIWLVLDLRLEILNLFSCLKECIEVSILAPTLKLSMQGLFLGYLKLYTHYLGLGYFQNVHRPLLAIIMSFEKGKLICTNLVNIWIGILSYPVSEESANNDDDMFCKLKRLIS